MPVASGDRATIGPPAASGEGIERVVEEADTSAFADLYRAEYPAAVRLAWLLTRDASVAEDVVQDAFAGLFRRGDGVGSAPGQPTQRSVAEPGDWVGAAARSRFATTQIAGRG